MDAGFNMPERFQVKADDGVTDLYGVMYKPFDFRSDQKISDHRVRVSRPADRKRDADVHAEQCERGSSRSSASS